MKATRLAQVLFGLLLLLPAATVLAQTTTPGTRTDFTKIDGDPLTINVGNDASFQIFNNAVPGQGQVYPSSCLNVADMGVFANIDGVLFSPNFGGHGCGSATGGIGTHTPWTATSLTPVTGSGTTGAPFTVTVRANAGTTGVSMTTTVTYVNGENFFRVRKRFTSARARRINIYFGADIFLGGSDAGTFFLEPTLNAPGGRDCAVPPTYNILFIPITPADSFTASSFGDVWRQIGINRLDDDATPTGCTDNGAAIEWKDVLRGRASAELLSAVSFGTIPPASAFEAFSISVNPDFATVLPGDIVQFTVTTSHSADSGFSGPLTLSLEGVPEGMIATLDRTSIPAPGDGTARLTVQLTGDVFPQSYRGLTVVATGTLPSGAQQSKGAAVGLNILCDPPFILGTGNPRSQTVSRGTSAFLSVRSERGGAAKYQWYRGFAPLTSSPIAGATSSTLTTPPITEPTSFWVRITNACGTADSTTATITPSF